MFVPYPKVVLPILLKNELSGVDPGFEKGGFNLVPNSYTGGATNDDV